MVALPRDGEKGSTGGRLRRFDELGRRPGLRASAAGAPRRARRGAPSARPRRAAAERPRRRPPGPAPLAAELLAAGAFRADVSGAGPAVYGLFTPRGQRARRRAGWAAGAHLGGRAGLVTSRRVTTPPVIERRRERPGPLASRAAAAARAPDRPRREPPRRLRRPRVVLGARARGRSRSRSTSSSRAAPASTLSARSPGSWPRRS